MPHSTELIDSARNQPEPVNSAAVSDDFDWHARYAWSPEVRIKQHDDSSIVVGIGHPRAHVLQFAPTYALAILQKFQQPARLSTAVDFFSADRSVWKPILRQLISTELLVRHLRPQSDLTAEFGPEYFALTAQFGQSIAERAVTARSDALVTVTGGGVLTEMIVDMLSQAGIGHVYQQQLVGKTATRFGPGGPMTNSEAHRRSRHTRRYKPAPQQRPTVAVVVATGMPLQSQAATLVSSRVPHLIVSATATRSVIGPFVLPGCNACRNCFDLHRRDADQYDHDDDHNENPIPIPIVNTYHTAVLAATELLAFIDGHTRPQTFGGELVQHHASMRLVSQTGGVHPGCACRRLAGH